VKLILAPTEREAETIAYERGIPPRASDTVLIGTDKPSSPRKVPPGMLLKRADVIIADGRRGRFHDEVMRTIEPGIVD
jgi:hypothetical protein